MSNEVIDFKIINDYIIEIHFKDGVSGKVDLKPYLNNEPAKDLLDKTKFFEMFIDSEGGLSWPNGFNMGPNFLRELIEKKPLNNVSV